MKAVVVPPEMRRLIDRTLSERLSAPGAIPNGARVRKSRMGPGDTHAVGELATVVASVGPVMGDYGYFVHWDDLPDVPVFILGSRIEAVP